MYYKIKDGSPTHEKMAGFIRLKNESLKVSMKLAEQFGAINAYRGVGKFVGGYEFVFKGAAPEGWVYEIFGYEPTDKKSLKAIFDYPTVELYQVSNVFGLSEMFIPSYAIDPPTGIYLAFSVRPEIADDLEEVTEEKYFEIWEASNNRRK